MSVLTRSSALLDVKDDVRLTTLNLAKSWNKINIHGSVVQLRQSRALTLVLVFEKSTYTIIVELYTE